MTIRTEMSTDLQGPLEQALGLGEISSRVEDGCSPEAEHVLMDSTLHGEILSLCGPQQEDGCIVDVVEPLNARVGHQVVVEEFKAAGVEATEIVGLGGRSVDNQWTDGAHDLLHGECDQDLTEIFGLSSTAECGLDHGDRFCSIAVCSLYGTQNSVEGIHLEQKIFNIGVTMVVCIGHEDLRILHASEKASRGIDRCCFCVDDLTTVELGFRARGGMDQVCDSLCSSERWGWG